MVLPSQTARPMNSSRFMYSRRRSRLARLAVVAIVIGGGGFLAWRAWFADDGATPEANGSPVAALPAGNGSGTMRPAKPEPATWKPSETNTGAPDPAPSEPRTVTMGPPPPAPEEDVVSPPRASDGGGRSEVTTERKPAQPKPAPVIDPDTIARASERLQRGLDRLNANDPVGARDILSAALVSGALDEDEAALARQTLGQINERLVFSPEVHPDDPFTKTYVVQPSEILSRIRRDQKLLTDWRFIMRVNRILDPRRVNAGQRLKLVTGRFDAVIVKRDFRMDIFLDDGVRRVFVRSFRVGLGEYGSTPHGNFVVRDGSRSVDPAWTNPRTGEHFEASNPANPIGDRWIGIAGVDPNNQEFLGYGIHGTVEPDSIGREQSMGCVRMLPDDVAIVYELLTDFGGSQITINGS